MHECVCARVCMCVRVFRVMLLAVCSHSNINKQNTFVRHQNSQVALVILISECRLNVFFSLRSQPSKEM